MKSKLSFFPSIKNWFFWVTIAISAIATFYWLVLASDRYVSEARVVLQRSDLASGQAMDFASLLSGANGGNRTDQLWLRDYLQSQDMLLKLDAKLQLRQHYSQQGDLLSRLWDSSAPIELFQQYFRKRVSIELDEYAGVLVIQTQAYSPEMAHAMTAFFLKEGEAAMNRLGHALAEEQVNYLEKQVADLGERVLITRAAVIAFQNKKGMVSPQATTENFAAVVAKLEASLSELQTRRNALLGYLQPTAVNVLELDQQIKAVQMQLQQEQGRLTSASGNTLNTTVEQYQRLEAQAEFAQNVFKTAIVALEKGRVDATRTLKKLAILQAPSMPEYPLQPSRIYNALVFVIFAFIGAGVLHLVLAIIRDHQD